MKKSPFILGDIYQSQLYQTELNMKGIKIPNIIKKHWDHI